MGTTSLKGRPARSLAFIRTDLQLGGRPRIRVLSRPQRYPGERWLIGRVRASGLRSRSGCRCQSDEAVLLPATTGKIIKAQLFGARAGLWALRTCPRIGQSSRMGAFRVVVILLAAGCVFTVGGDRETPRARASFDMQCPAADLRVTELDAAVAGVDGCGRRET